MNLSYILNRVARAYPDASAITSYDGRLTYGELERQVAQIAGQLRGRHGLSPGDRVGIAMTNCAAFFPCLFGAWRAGLVAVPINAKLHPREMAWILENAGAKLAIMTPELAASVSEAADVAWPTVIATDEANYARLLQGDGAALLPGEPGDPAWLFYTSGTTGRPKGAVLTHRNLLFCSHAYCADINPAGPGTTMVHAAPLSHGAGIYGLAHLIKGGYNVIYMGFVT